MVPQREICFVVTVDKHTHIYENNTNTKLLNLEYVEISEQT